MIRHARIICLLGAWILVLLLLGLKLPQVAWNSSITAALPSAQEPWQQQLLKQNRSSRQFSLLLSGPDTVDLQGVAQQLQHLQEGVTWHQPLELMQMLQQQYQAHQGQLASDEHWDLLSRGEYEALIQSAWQRILSPAPVLDQALVLDPLLLTQQYLEQQSGGYRQLRPALMGFEWRSGDRAVMLLNAELEYDPFENQQQAQLLDDRLTQLVDELRLQWSDLQLSRSGVLFHAVAAAQTARSEMTLFGGLSALIILLMLVLVFRSLKPLWLSGVVMLISVTTGLTALLLIFPQPHILALVFATTLIGIAVDYSFHGMVSANQSAERFRNMLPSLTLGLLSTLLGYLLLIWLPFSLLQQVAVFIAGGLIAAYLSVWVLYPYLIKAGQFPVSRWACAVSHHLALRIDRTRRHRAIFLLLVAVVIAVGSYLANPVFTDSVRAFNQTPALLAEQERQVRQLGAQPWDSRFLVVLADDIESVLQQEEMLKPLLHQWQQQGILSGWQALSDRVPSHDRQEALQQMLGKAYQSSVVQQFLDELGLEVPTPVQSKLDPESLQLFTRQHLVAVEEQLASLIFLSGLEGDANMVHDSVIQEELDKWPQVHWFDPVGDADNSIGEIREQLGIWILLALGLSVLLLSWRLGPARSAATLLYLLIAMAGSLAFSQWFQSQLTLFNLVAVLLVLALALDYAVFFASELPLPEVIQAVSLSALTSGVAFGLLSFSQTPAIAAFGLTVFSGVALAALFAPLISCISGRGKR
ncbi:MMPL family transporter [Nitrincola sp. MINF-07-Sa-05]|uniref:MMPL family transporter n=1 Tax=Nitrincola salilacus TaxID=3400273 RepID=UPI003917FC97